MSGSTPRGIARLRTLLASIIADHSKAYDLPPLGERLGLAPGTDSEAMNSKRLYITKRLQSLDDHEVRRIAGELARDVQNDELDALLVESSSGDAGISSALIRFDREVVHRRWTDASERRSTDPEGAITHHTEAALAERLRNGDSRTS